MIDLNKEYGIVLEGGGAKGAYQIGVWKALKESGVKIKGIAGVSVGALNGTLMCMDDVKLAEDIWTNISYSQVMDVDDEDMENLLHHNLRQVNLAKFTKTGAKAVISGGIDITPLKELIEKYVDETKVKESETELVMGTLSLSELKGKEIEAKMLEEGELKDYLIASASLPVFKQEKLQGKTYLDGGMVNNVPIDMLIKREYKDIIVIRIYGIGIERKVKIPEDVTIHEISPRVDLGNILEFDSNKARRNIKIGYFDAMRLIHGLEGKIYYLKDIFSEREHLERLLMMEEEVKKKWLEFLKEEITREELIERKFLEIVLPTIADKFGLAKNWTYTELYISMLELSAKTLKVMKYKVYSEEEFINEIKVSFAQNSIMDETDQLKRMIICTMAGGRFNDIV